MFLIWEGVDKVGKDTAKNAFDKRTSYLYTNLNRGPIGYLSYDEIFNRLSEQRLDDRLESWNEIKDDSLVIYLYADAAVLEKRIEKAGDDPISRRDLIDHMNVYEKNLIAYVDPTRLVRINTNNVTVDDVCDIVSDKIAELQLVDSLELLGASGCFTRLDGNRICKTYNPIFKTFTAEELRALGSFDESYDEMYYEQLKMACLHKLFLYQNNLITFRQICEVQSDCISFVQFVFENEDAHIYAVQRSWNAKGNGLNDLTFYVWLMEAAKENNLLPQGVNADNFTLHWWCTIPHVFFGGE